MPSAREIGDTILDTPIQRAGPGQTGTTTLRAVIAGSDDATARHAEQIRTIVREELLAHLVPAPPNQPTSPE